MLEDFSAKAVKRILFLFNLFFVLTGLVLILVGVVIKSYFKEYEPFIDDRFFSASSLLLISGSIIFAISFFGCCGALKENRCMIYTFSLLLTLVMILEFASGVTAYVLANQTTTLLDAKLHDTMKLYKNVTDVQILWDTVQGKFSCCGITNSSDWVNVGVNLPVSCCVSQGVVGNLTCVAGGNNVFNNSCSQVLSTAVEENVSTLGGAAFTIVAAQILGIIFAVYLARYIKKSTYETV